MVLSVIFAICTCLGLPLSADYPRGWRGMKGVDAFVGKYWDRPYKSCYTVHSTYNNSFSQNNHSPSKAWEEDIRDFACSNFRDLVGSSLTYDLRSFAAPSFRSWVFIRTLFHDRWSLNLNLSTFCCVGFHWSVRYSLPIGKSTFVNDLRRVFTVKYHV